MRNSSARRVALVGVSLAVVIGMAAVTSACGVRPTATAADPVIIPQATSSSSAPSATTPSETSPPTVDPSVNSTTVPEAAPPVIDPQVVVAAAAGVEPNTTLGAVVYDRTLDRVLLSVNPDRQFRSASLVKLLIAIDALNRGADESTREKIARMLSLSDDNLASALWVQGGGAALVTRAAQLIGLQSTEPPEVSGKWGEVKLTANDMVRAYQYVMNGLAPADHTLIVDALAQAPEYAADDFRQYFGIPDGLNTQWAIKQGWGNNNSAMVLHSTGLVGPEWRYVVILLTEHPLGSGWTTSARSVTAAAAALTGQLAGV